MGGAGTSHIPDSIFRSVGVRSDSQAVVSAHYFVHAPRILQTYASSVTLFKICGDCKMEKPALELVLQALDALYRKEDPTEKEKASQWLMQLQASVSSPCGLISAHQSWRGPYRTHTVVHTEL